MDPAMQRMCAWTGPVLIAVFFIGFWPIAGFMPPPSPEDSAREVAEFYRDDTDRIRIGLVIAMFGVPLFITWGAALSVQMKRMEGRSAPLAYAQMAFIALIPLEFIFPMFFWEAAAFRPEERSPEDLQLLNDIGWLPFVGLIFTAVPWAFVIGLAILRDRRAVPILPRWSGYLTIWTGFLYAPGCLCVFFKDGAFSWTGVISFWVVIVTFPIWILIMTRLLLRAVTRQEAEETSAQPEPVPQPI